MTWDTLFQQQLLQNEPLAKYTAARLGGRADWLYIAKPKSSVDDLINIIQSAWKADISVRLLGGGANVLVSDKGFRGLVIVNHLSDIRFEEDIIHANSGTSLVHLARRCQSQGYKGMEWAIGVPGTVGGAVVNNAGAHGTEMKDSIVTVTILDAEQGQQQLRHADLNFAYRESALKKRPDKRFLVLSATLKLGKDHPDAIQERMNEFNAYRKRTQPPGASLGSIFKNPPNDYAGRLIESCGLKGYTIGNAQVSPVHANFFINAGGTATATDYYRLIQHVQSNVQHQTGISLQLEVELFGEWDT